MSPKPEQDWGVPTDPPEHTTSRFTDPWVVVDMQARDFSENWAVVERPDPVPNLRQNPRVVASCERKGDAELIVELYESARKAQA